MRTRRLGTEGPEVSVVGLGCNNFGRRLDLDATRAVVDAALAEGITLLDTADIYGETLSAYLSFTQQDIWDETPIEVNGTVYNAAGLPANIAGSSADTGGSSTVSSVQVAIQDGAGNYWGGATFNQGSIFYNATGGTVGAWTYSTATLAGQLTDGHTYTITPRSTDAAGNTGTTTRAFVYDTTAPIVTNVSSTKADGAYPAGVAFASPR